LASADLLTLLHLIFVVCSIQALLSAPNPDDPLADNVAKHWKANETEAVETGEGVFNLAVLLATDYIRLLQWMVFSNGAAKEWTRLYASGE
jgi:hypothetical protein